MTVFFTGDTHWFHHNVIHYDNRPFRDVAEMNAALIANWNNVVGDNDVVYHLGDVAICGTERTMEILRQLHGRVHLIRGNHDTGSLRRECWKWFASVSKQLEITVDGVELFLTHRPQGNWPRRKEGVLHLHGHSHGKSERNIKGRYDVGCMLWGYTPRTVKEIIGNDISV